MKPYEIIDHTADIGLRIYGKDWEALLKNAGFALFDLITNAASIEPKLQVPISLEGKNREDLFLQWLRELLYLFSTKQFVFKDFNFQELTENRLKGIAQGGIFDPKSHEQRMEVKAVTYHQFKLEEQKSGWVAEVILDI